MKFNYGIISTAEITKRFIPAVRIEGGTVHAAASRNFKKAKQFCKEQEIKKAYGSYKELYEDSAIHIVYIATINSTHISEVKQALSYGKHVICEKPLALCEKDAKEIFELANKKGLFLMEAQKSVFLPITNVIKAYIESGELGALHQVEMTAGFASPAAPWMHVPGQGGVVYGSASYTIEYLDYLLQPDSILVQAQGTKEANGTIDSVNINLKMDEVLINSRITMKCSLASSAIFYFDTGYIKIKDYWKARECEIHSEKETKIVRFPEEFEMRYETAHIHECLKKGLLESPIMNSERTIKCCRLVEKIISEIS